MAKKFKPSTQANMLRSQGVEALGTNIYDTNVNPIGFYTPDKTKYELIWSMYDMQQCISRYKWNDMPNGITGELVERMLYFRHSVAGFKYAGNVYILPWVMQGGLNIYGYPNRIKPMTYNGQAVAGDNDYFKQDFELPVDKGGDLIDNYTAVLLFDDVPNGPSGIGPSRFALNQVIIKEICDTFARININIVVSNKKILLYIKDPKQRSVIQKELEIAFGSDSPFALITAPLEPGSIQTSNDYYADELFNAIKNYDGIRCFMSGISAKGFGNEKKERLVSGELAGNEEEKDLILDLGLSLRKQFCDRCNKLFGTNMSVEIRKSNFCEQVDGNNMNEEEREKEL